MSEREKLHQQQQQTKCTPKTESHSYSASDLHSRAAHQADTVLLAADQRTQRRVNEKQDVLKHDVPLHCCQQPPDTRAEAWTHSIASRQNLAECTGEKPRWVGILEEVNSAFPSLEVRPRLLKDVELNKIRQYRGSLFGAKYKIYENAVPDV